MPQVTINKKNFVYFFLQNNVSLNHFTPYSSIKAKENSIISLVDQKNSNMVYH